MPDATPPPKDDQTALTARKNLSARTEHVLTRVKDWQTLRQCRRRNNINHPVRALAYLRNLRLAHLRINS